MDKRLLVEPYTIADSISGKDTFSYIFTYEPEDDGMYSKHGELYVVLSSSVSGIEADWGQVAVELFEALKTSYYTESSSGIQHDLEDALSACRESFERTVQQLAGGTPVDLHIGALVIWGGSFVYHSAGKVYFALVRNGALVDMAGDRFVQEAVQDGDVFVLGTSVFGQRIDSSLVHHITQSKASEDWQNALRDEVKAVEAGALLSGMVLNVREEELPDEDDVIELKLSASVSGNQRPAVALPSRIPRMLTSIFHKTSEGFGSAVAVLTSLIKRSQGTSEVYVEQEKHPASKKKWLIVFGLVLLLCASIFITYRLNNRKDRIAREEQAMSDLIAGLKRVEELQHYDQVQAKRAFELLKEQMGQVQGVSDSLEGQFQQTYNSLYSVNQASWVPYEAGLGGNTRITAGDNGNIVAVDADSGVLKILSADGSFEDFGQVSEFAGVSYIVPGAGGVYGYHSQTGLWFYSFSTSSVEQIMTQSGRWGNARGLDRYEDNVYILAPEAQELVKYVGLGGGSLSGGTSYFVDPLDYAALLDVAIDGHIFTLSENNYVEKFLAGRRVEFTLRGIYPEGQPYRSITTGVGYENLYIMTDSGVFVFSVEGEYQNMLSGPGQHIKEVAVNTDESLIVVVTDAGLLRASF